MALHIFEDCFHVNCNTLCVGTVLASSAGPRARGEADQGQRSGEKT